uniref:RanBD1 domain-containing protein n=1 Tax=Sinocyclocheilus grahami TaxID=75366 RepID=A0A672S1U0_SINGR
MHDFTAVCYGFNLNKLTKSRSSDQYITSQDFGSTATQNGLKEIHNGGVESRSDETTLDDIHFKPIVSLPEVVVKSGEEDEEILFKERTKLYCWDCENELWKERGVGDIKILFHPVRKTYLCVHMCFICTGGNSCGVMRGERSENLGYSMRNRLLLPLGIL